MRFPLLIAAVATLAASPLAAQHCWPTSIALVVRDPRGAVLDPRPLMDSLSYAPARGQGADFQVRAARIHPDDTNEFDQPGGIPVIVWYGQGDCRVDVREVVLRRGGAVMRLWMDLHLDSERRPGPSDYLLKAPQFAAGTWRLDVCMLPEPKTNTYGAIPARWTRVSASGDAALPWQAPQGCGGRR
ncbi:hypothetical protein [Longimicrobium sp.]|uniref:hypothetical protein n=1 Tax=Longimicrobium sp. TaxID=2029185 RepID=UPI002BD1D659|nr:hypothetical protein [Longimicrobium sp.]HSU13164.1 hypothetical protein [Longimicrobium sp.]